MPPTIHFYFDFTSPYGYLAAMQIDALAAKYGNPVEWHPILLGVIFKATGAMPLADIPLKGKYTLVDLKRSAQFYHIPYRHPPKFPVATHVAARAMLWISNTMGKENAVKFAKAVYQAYFVQGLAIDEPEQIAKIATQLGWDGKAIMQESASQVIKDQFRAEVAEAQAKEVFGSPFVIVSGEPFWGVDRFNQLEERLKSAKG